MWFRGEPIKQFAMCRLLFLLQIFVSGFSSINPIWSLENRFKINIVDMGFNCLYSIVTLILKILRDSNSPLSSATRVNLPSVLNWGCQTPNCFVLREPLSLLWCTCVSRFPCCQVLQKAISLLSFIHDSHSPRCLVLRESISPQFRPRGIPHYGEKSNLFF